VTGWRKRQIKEYEMTDKVAQEKALQALHSENERLGLYKDAYAQPEQEPVAWVNKERNTITWDKLYPDMDALYTHPPQRTEQEPVALPCCGYTDASAVKWNPFNRIVQCHNCGQTYTPPKANQ